MLLLPRTDDYTVELAGHRFGFSDWTVAGWGKTSEFTKIETTAAHVPRGHRAK
jgi:hypothetical protein